MGNNEKTYDGQTATFLAALATCMPRGLNRETMQGWIDNPTALQKVLAEALCPPSDRELFDPNEFFVICEGLWVSDNFCNYILSVAKKIPVSSLKPAHFNLPDSMDDKEIRAKLGKNYVFGASEVCSIIGNMISCQPNEREGDLLVDGYVNIFYVRGKNNEVFVVDVDWYADGREWRVHAYRLDGLRWVAGDCVFSRNNILAK